MSQDQRGADIRLVYLPSGYWGCYAELTMPELPAPRSYERAFETPADALTWAQTMIRLLGPETPASNQKQRPRED